MPDLEVRQIAHLGWKRSLPDFRDLLADPSGIKVLPERDPRADMSKPYNQYNLGSCTGNAVAGAVEYDFLLSGHPFPSNPSRLFIYYGERELEGSASQDAGAFGRDGFKVAHKVGVPDETIWPYDIARFKDRPSQQAYEDAGRHKIGQYKAVPRGKTSFKRVLSNRQTIAFGFSVFESFESDEVARTGIMPIPQKGERMLGGHEVLLVGYLKSEKDYALVRNSWGTDWGIGGYFLMPWKFLLDPQMCDDFRTIYRPLGQ